MPGLRVRNVERAGPRPPACAVLRAAVPWRRRVLIYAVQAWLYTLMLAQSRGIKVTRRLIVRLHKDAEEPEVVEALDLEAEARALVRRLASSEAPSAWYS